MEQIYLIYGEDEFLKQATLLDLTSNLQNKQIDKVVIYNPKEEEILAEIQMPDFFSNQKMLVFKNTGFFDEKQSEKLKISEILELFGKGDTELKNILGDKILVFVEENAEDSKLLQLFLKSKLVSIHKCMKMLFQERAKYIFDLAKKDGIDFAYKDVMYLVNNVEDDTFIAINEYKKLAFLESTISKKSITKKDIDENCILKDENVIYKIMDQIYQKEYEKVFKQIDDYTKNNQIQIIYSYIYKFLRNVYICSITTKEAKLPEILNLKPNQRFLVNKYMEFAKRLGPKKLRYILDEIIQKDQLSKKETIDLGLELKLVLKLI